MQPLRHQKLKQNLLTQLVTWKFSAATVAGLMLLLSYKLARKIISYPFMATGTGTLMKAQPNVIQADPQSIPFTWNFASNETILHISASYLPAEAMTLH